MTTQVTLGAITLESLEIPEAMPFGVTHSLAVQKLIGGARVIDAMGRDDTPISWSGWIMGPNAVERAQYLHTQCVLGQSITLTWDTFNYQVVISSFEPSYEFAYRIKYTITCEIVQDNTSPVNDVVDSGIDDTMNSDLASAVGLAALVGNAQLASLVGNVGTAIAGVPTFTNATDSVLSSVQLPIQVAQTQVQSLLAASTSSMGAGAPIGGVSVGVPITSMESAITQSSTALATQPSLLSLSGVLGRMSANLNSIRSSNSTITVAGGSLYDIASKQYGDPTSWTAIAKANGLTDPELSNIQDLIIPTLPDTAGGLLDG